MDNQQQLDTPVDSVWVQLTPAMIGLAGKTNRHLRLWSLVLASQNIPYQLVEKSGWQLLVHEELCMDAIRQIQIFEEKNKNWPIPAPLPRPQMENSLATLSVLILLAGFYNIVQSGVVVVNGELPDWQQLGMVQAGRIRVGEWWRLITALTLHADLQHLLGNLAIGGVFILLLCRQLGTGLSWTLLLLAGAVGNLVNVWLQPVTHNSVGASTAVFGAVGILAAISMVRYHHHLKRSWPVPLAAAVALLALLGSEGRHADLGAHLFGLLAGGLLGIVTELLTSRYGYPGRNLNLLLAILSGLLVLIAWLAALAG